MLVLSRKLSEGIILQIPNPDGTISDVCIRIVDVVNSRKVRVGIEAPKEITVVREELLAKRDG